MAGYTLFLILYLLWCMNAINNTILDGFELKLHLMSINISLV